MNTHSATAVDTADHHRPFWLRLDEAADHARYSKATLRRALKKGNLLGFKPGREWRIRIEDLESWLRR